LYKIVRRPPCWKSTARLVRHARLDLLDWLDKVERVESSRAKWNLSHIIAYRKTAREATAKVVAQLARKRFECTRTPRITSEQYVQGVVAAYDQARRSIMDDLRRCLEEERTSIVSIRQWIKEQPSPLCPTQCLMIKTAQQKKLLHIYVVLSTVDHNLL